MNPNPRAGKQGVRTRETIGLPELDMMDNLGIWPTQGPEHPMGSPHPLTASQLLDSDSFLPLHRNGREEVDQQLGGWQGLETGSPAPLTLGEGTYCCGPRRGQCPRSRPHSQCLRYLHCCPLGMCPERRRACLGLVLRVLCYEKTIRMQLRGENEKLHGSGVLSLLSTQISTFEKQRLHKVCSSTHS